MEFSEQYLTYSEYTGLGGTLPETSFNILEFEARRRIDIVTQDRLNDGEEKPQTVKLCVFNMINSIERYASSISDGNVANESTDGYSISYITSKDVGSIVKSKQSDLDDIIKTYLLNVVYKGEHLMYAGVK